MLKDFMKDAEGLHQVAYRIEVRVDTEFKDYVEFIIEGLEKSIAFLLGYSNSVSAPQNYDSKNMQFKKSFSDSIMNQLGISEGDSSINLGSNRIKNSEFGIAALNYYNGLLLLTKDVEKSIYGQTIKSLLPTSKTSPEKIKLILSDFDRLVSTIRREYNIENRDSKSSGVTSKVSSIKSTNKDFVSVTTEKMIIEREVLGYNIFSESQKGLNKFTTDSYRQRIGAEQTKYYPSMDVADDANFMTSKERSAFMANSNAPSFVTPANLVLGKKKITCSRGMNNIDVNMVKEFRLAKSARAAQMKKTVYPSGLRSAQLSENVMADFNITIGPSKTSILERASDIEIDPLQDAKYYVGESSYFTTNNPELIYKNFKNLINKEDRRIFAIVSDVIPGRFLKQNGSIESISELQLGNNKSRIRGLVSEERINFEEIPPQIKSMMTKNFQNNAGIDPLKNRESRTIIDETQKNVFQVRAHTGFELDEDGFPDLNRPILKEMSDASLGVAPVLAKAYNYEVPELGIVKDKFMPTIYNNLVYVRG